MNLERLATDLAYWNEMDPTGGEATHYNRACMHSWLRQDPAGYFLNAGVWGKYHHSGTAEKHIEEAVPKPVEKRVAWDGVEWPIPVGQWARAELYGRVQDVQVVAHVRQYKSLEVVFQGETEWDFNVHPEDFTPFPDVAQERKRQEAAEEFSEWVLESLGPCLHKEDRQRLVEQLIEDADFFKEVLDKL